MNIISLESTFDDTCMCILKKKKILEIKIVHKNLVGVVPKITTNRHIKNFKNIFKIFKKEKVDYISYSYKPGLPGSINVSKSFSMALSYMYKKKIFKVNHLKAHIFSYFIGKKKIFFPFISFVLTGANTKIFLFRNFKKYKLIGKTIDNALGDTINKIGRYMNLKYPCHNKVEKYLKKKYDYFYVINKPKISLINFSYSGIITKIKKLYDKNKKIKNIKGILFFSFFNFLIKDINKKICYIKKKYKINYFIFCGGVSSSNFIRKNISKVKFVKKKFCEDNASMISFYTYLWLHI
ncbi:hypothetical protein ACT2CI_00245 [Candidatus Vidania fulgoroideorum]